MSTSEVTETINFMDRQTQGCPYAAYSKMNAAGGVTLEESTGFYIVTNYELVRKLATDNQRLSSQTGMTGRRTGGRQDEINKIHEERGLPLRDTLIFTDPPDHTSHRALVDQIFSAARVAEMETYIREVVDDYIDKFIDKGKVDIHNALSVMTPMSIIADQIGLPRTEKDLERLKCWSEAIMLRTEPNLPFERQVELAEIICEAQTYLAQKIESYRVAPADCMLSDMAHAEINGERMDVADLVSIMLTIFAAGNETTTTAISNCLIRLMQEPGLEDRLRENPCLIPQFTEEGLRIDSPLQGFFRRATVDMEIGEFHVPAGSTVVLRYGGANHDPLRFPDPQRFDPDRKNSRQHIAFSAGPHFCVGHQLARSELRLTFEHILRRIKNIRLADRPDAVTRLPHYLTFGLRNLHIIFDKVPVSQKI